MRTLITVLIMFPVLIKEQQAPNLQGNETSSVVKLVSNFKQ